MEEDIHVAKSSVPKFGSFQPPPQTGKTKLDKEAKGGSNDHRVHKGSSKSKETKSGKDGHKDKFDRHESGHKKHRHRKKEGVKAEEAPTADLSVTGKAEETEDELFTVDKLGDAANLTYGGPHQYAVPPYRRVGAGNVVGQSRNYKIDRITSTEKYVVVSQVRDDPSSERKSLLFKAKSNRSRELRIKANLSTIEDKTLDSDFIALGLKRKRRTGSTGSNSASDVDNYRSIDGKAKLPDDPDDVDLEYARGTSEEDTGLQRIDEDLRRAGAALSLVVDREPKNGQAWIDLITHQDKLLDSNKRSKVTCAEKLSTADIKLSMYEKALGKVEDLQYRERLLLGMIEEGSKIWETSKLSSKWRNTLSANPSYFQLWVKFLDFQQTTFMAFKYHEYRDSSRQCLKMLEDLKQREKTGNLNDLNQRLQTYVLLRLTSGIREAGFSEHAFAIWQAVLEFNLFRPSPIDLDLPQTASTSDPLYLTSFVEFWESEVPRIGEEVAQGWSYWVKYGGSANKSRKDPQDQPLNEGAWIESWLNGENLKALQARRPARTEDDVGEDDPYKVILTFDILPFLLECPSSATHQVDLIYAFLAFCHLPPPRGISEDIRKNWRDGFIRNESVHQSDKLLSRWKLSKSGEPEVVPGKPIESKNPQAVPVTSANFLFPAPNYLTSSDTMLSGRWFSSFDVWKTEYNNDSGPIEMDSIHRVLIFCVERGVGGDSLAEYLIAFECKIYPENARKTAKRLVKKQASNLSLYNAYALCEFRLGKTSTANHVIATAINMSKTLGEGAKRDAILLWRTWIWEILDSVDDKGALERLLTYGSAEINPELQVVKNNDLNQASIRLLKVLRALSDGRDQMLSLGSYYYASLYSECLVLLTYLTNGSSLDALLSCFNSNAELYKSRLPQASQAYELLHQSRAKILHHHVASKRAFKPALIRSTLAESINIFPHNTIFLSLYAWNEARFRIDNRVQTVIHNVISSSNSSSLTESIITHFFAIYTELSRSIIEGSNTHTIRSTFERAVESTIGKHSAALWKLYLLFECEKVRDMERAKRVFYRGIRACPWVKEMYMLAFRYLRGVMSVEELKGVYRAMEEKGLRIHVSLDEVWESLEGKK
ncbi:MAG: hypothetical protein MMC33_002919 [Icmadophila ericetorum]|nr:hypothetical protein [Icmadophila ericetorum]